MLRHGPEFTLLILESCEFYHVRRFRTCYPVVGHERQRELELVCLNPCSELNSCSRPHRSLLEQLKASARDGDVKQQASSGTHRSQHFDSRFVKLVRRPQFHSVQQTRVRHDRHGAFRERVKLRVDLSAGALCFSERLVQRFFQ